MTGISTWNVLSSRDSTSLIIASDFPATGRTVAGFGDLVAAGALDGTVWETAPPPAGTEVGMTGGDYVERWLTGLEAERRPIRAVLGFCVGAVFAATLAERIAERQGQPPVVLMFDPERPDVDLLSRHYRELIGGLSAVLSAEEIDIARRAGEQARHDHDTMPEAAAALCKLFAEFGGPAFERTGLDAVRSGELVATFTSFLFYLVAAGDLDPTAVWARATAINSASELNGLNAVPADRRDRLVAREIRADLPHTELLRDAGVARTVRELLGQSG
jgi:hypothetical protein